MKTNIFITGATGNVGGKLVPLILRHVPDAHVTLLVRGQSQEQATERAIKTITKLTPEFDPKTCPDRLRVMSGDITDPHLGLSACDYDRLAAGVTHIIHSAAATKFLMPADQARSINYHGTRHVIRLALRARELGNSVRFAHISTAFACGNRSGSIFEETHEDKPEFSNIYEQTKWETECYLHSIKDDLSVSVFRPSIIVGDSRTGRINDFNVLYQPLRLILTGHVRILPCHPDTPLDIVPLDYVGQAITRIFFDRLTSDGRIYHIVSGAGHETCVKAIVDAATGLINRWYPDLPVVRIKYVPAAAFGLRLLHGLKIRNRAMSIMDAYLPYFTQSRHFDCANTRAALEGLINPPGLDTYFENLMTYFVEENLRRRLKVAA